MNMKYYIIIFSSIPINTEKSRSHGIRKFIVITEINVGVQELLPEVCKTVCVITEQLHTRTVIR